MGNRVIVDTCFLDRFKQGTELSKDLNNLINASDFNIVVHPYVYEHEMDVFSYTKTAVDVGFLEVIAYDEFLPDSLIKEYYKGLFIDIYNTFYERLLASDNAKAQKMKLLDAKDDIFSIRFGGSSIGDVHIVMLALFSNLPIILSEDSDMVKIYNIAKNKMNRNNFSLKVLRVNDLIDELERRGDSLISHGDLKRMRRAYGRN